MHVKEVSAEEYIRNSSKSRVVFNKSEFVETNRKIVIDIKYLIIYKGESARFLVYFGIKDDGGAYCPFSAPFAYIEPIKTGLGVQDYEKAIYALDDYFLRNKIPKATMVFPPEFYDKRNVNTWIQIMLRDNWIIDYVDISFGFCLRNVVTNYEEKLARNARKNLRIALDSNLQIFECQTIEEKKEAYRIIKVNRESKGYPLRMSEAQVLNVINIVPSKMFIVKDDNQNLAAALVYEVADSIAQVVCWGDIPGFSEKKVINYLAYQLIKIYNEMGFEYLDIGPSSEYGIPNYGLCDFKDSIGCDRSMKFRLSKRFCD